MKTFLFFEKSQKNVRFLDFRNSLKTLHKKNIVIGRIYVRSRYDLCDYL